MLRVLKNESTSIVEKIKKVLLKSKQAIIEIDLIQGPKRSVHCKLLYVGFVVTR